jgi:hypothetical protein
MSEYDFEAEAYNLVSELFVFATNSNTCLKQCTNCMWMWLTRFDFLVYKLEETKT